MTRMQSRCGGGVLLALVLTLAGGAARAEAPEIDAERKALNGTWEATHRERGGENKAIPSPGVVEKRIALTFSGESVTVTIDLPVGDGTQGVNEVAVRGTYRIDPSKTPAELELVFKPDGREIKIPGIYRLGTDSLVVASPQPGKGERPKDFKSKEGDGVDVISYKRVKEGK